MVVIVGEFTNITVNLTRGDKINSACTTVSNNNILNESLYDVFGFDIEFDNSVSSFLIPGVIERNNATRLTCDSGNASAIPMISRKLVEIKTATIVCENGIISKKNDVEVIHII